MGITVTDEVIHKFNDLFIAKRSKYLILKNNGSYTQANKNNPNFRELNDSHVRSHLNGKQTVGVFSGDFLTKFICFDVDFHEPKLAKWYTYKVIESLVSVGIPVEFIYISTSGNKGYHVDVYFNKMISLNLSKSLYDLIMENGNLYSNHGMVEFRPSQQGVKLPLGINFKNKNNSTNRCWYVDYDNNLKPIKSFDYILDIKQLNSDIIVEIIQSYKDLTIEDTPRLPAEGLEVESNKDYFDIKHNPLDVYKKNIDPNTTIEAALKLIQEGLKFKGSRHNSLFLICRYYKYLDCNQEENENMLMEWMLNQKKDTYTTTIKECKKDIKLIAKYIYDNDLGLTFENKEIIITYSEMLSILKAKNINDKLIAYSMLVHSKQYSSNNGVFYMTYSQMAQTTGFSESTTYRNVKKLEELNIIEVVERNVNAGTSKNKFKKPNRYRFIDTESTDKKQLVFNKDYLNEENDFGKLLTASIISLFDTSSLKVLLPKNQYYTYKGIIDNASSDI